MPVSEVSVFFDTQVRMPNGLQWFGDELFVMDQLTDDVFVLDEDGKIKRVISTETENGSGMPGNRARKASKRSVQAVASSSSSTPTPLIKKFGG